MFGFYKGYRYNVEKETLVDMEDVRSSIEQEVYCFVVEVLKAAAVPKELLKFLPDQVTSVSIDNKILLRKILKTYQISVIEDIDGGRIALQQPGESITLGSWKKAHVEYMSDVDAPRHLYAKIIFVTESILEVKN